MTQRPPPQAEAPDPVSELYARPGFLIRRAHQIAVGLFLEEAGEVATTTQYGAMVVLDAHDDLDQIGLSKRLGIDRSTTALVVGKLEAAGYLVREADAGDRRRNVLRLTSSGVDALATLAEPATRARVRLLAALTDPEAKRLIALLDRFVAAFNGHARAPIAEARAPSQGRDRGKA